MNIAIVNDEKIDLETAEIFLRFYIKKFWADYESKINIEVFYSARDFMQIFDVGLYHVIILGTNLAEVAEFIRASGDYDAKVIFLKFNDNSEEGGGDL